MTRVLGTPLVHLSSMQPFVRDSYCRVRLSMQASWPNECVCICAAQTAQGPTRAAFEQNLEFLSHAELIIREACIMHVANQTAVKSSKAVSQFTKGSCQEPQVLN